MASAEHRTRARLSATRLSWNARQQDEHEDQQEFGNDEPGCRAKHASSRSPQEGRRAPSLSRRSQSGHRSQERLCEHRTSHHASNVAMQHQGRAVFRRNDEPSLKHEHVLSLEKKGRPGERPSRRNHASEVADAWSTASRTRGSVYLMAYAVSDRNIPMVIGYRAKPLAYNDNLPKFAQLREIWRKREILYMWCNQGT